ncbi:hypothetical protein IW262DRAFT_670162 [Armillaria fumosa]|nr:hypothetical protein IW262DRAFT_670162 [Armillaria fumosa]
MVVHSDPSPKLPMGSHASAEIVAQKFICNSCEVPVCGPTENIEPSWRLIGGNRGALCALRCAQGSPVFPVDCLTFPGLIAVTTYLRLKSLVGTTWLMSLALVAISLCCLSFSETVSALRTCLSCRSSLYAVSLDKNVVAIQTQKSEVEGVAEWNGRDAYEYLHR